MLAAMSSPVFRFAPSPNGDLHLGHALSALVNAGAAARMGGRLLVRIEDIDPERCTAERIRATIEDLLWLGIAFETPVRLQSEHMADYAAALGRLGAAGLVYKCFASRGEIARAVADRDGWPRDPDGAPLYPGLWRGADAARIADAEASGLPFAWRLDVDEAAARAGPLAFEELGRGTIPADPRIWGDVVVARKETPTSYHLAVVVDDAAQGVTHVVRGEDLYAATAVHRLLQVLLGLPAPRYHHHRLILDREGRKLAKSRGSESLKALRALGTTPDEVRRLTHIGPADLAVFG